jgi:LysR family transcriptional regulator, nitrogen assimilation regulatory protein
MDLRQLRYFVAVAETGSFNAAAGTLHIAQSALSRHVQALEQACGGPLMERSVRGVTLTEAGELLLARARFLLAEAANAVSEVNELNGEPGGLVRLAAPPSFGDILYPPLAIKIAALFPRVQLELREEMNDEALSELRQGALELAVVSAPEPDPRIAYTPLCAEPMMLVGAPDDPRLAVTPFPLDGLPALPLLLPIGVGWLSVARRRLGRQADLIQARSPVRVQSPGPIKAMLRAGLGFGVLPASAIHQEIVANYLSATPIEDFCVMRVLAAPHDRPLRRAATAETISSEVAAIIAAGKLGWRCPPKSSRRNTALPHPPDRRPDPPIRRPSARGSRRAR